MKKQICCLFLSVLLASVFCGTSVYANYAKIIFVGENDINMALRLKPEPGSFRVSFLKQKLREELNNLSAF